MKQIKKVVLKDTKRLSPDEMKLVFGGSGTNVGMPSEMCNLPCNDFFIVTTIENCPEGCMSNYLEQTLTCSGTNSVMTFVCSGGLITSSVVTIEPPI